MAHKLQWFSALIFSFLGLIIQVWIPKILQNGITNALILKTQPLHDYVELIAVLALFTGVFGYISRTNLFKVAYAIEFDLRNILYEHFTRMSFPFYDRVQSGQLISRANSDIRSVQMYLTFAPMILVQCSIALVAFAFMLSISVPLAFVAMASMPFIYIVGMKMRKSLFPVSWLIQSRLAEVATVVDENVNGVRVVRSFAAEQQQLRPAGQGGRPGPVGLHQGRRPPRPLRPAGAEPLPGRARPGAAGRRVDGHPRAPARRVASSRSTSTW